MDLNVYQRMAISALERTMVNITELERRYMYMTPEEMDKGSGTSHYGDITPNMVLNSALKTNAKIEAAINWIKSK